MVTTGLEVITNLFITIKYQEFRGVCLSSRSSNKNNRRTNNLWKKFEEHMGFNKRAFTFLSLDFPNSGDWNQEWKEGKYIWINIIDDFDNLS